MSFNITPVASGYQEIHPYSVMNIDSVKINTSLIMMKECLPTTLSMKSTIGPKTIQILIPKVYLPQGVFSKTNWQVYLAYAPPELCKFIYLWSAPQLPRRWNLWSVKLPAGF